MNRLILCEGKTDAILISYYLAKTAGWQYSRTCPNGLDIKTNKGNEAIKGGCKIVCVNGNML